MYVRPKKHLGQHFLKDELIAQNIADALQIKADDNVLEVGAGTGMLTQFLINKTKNFFLTEIDEESIRVLREKYPKMEEKILHADFLKFNLEKQFPEGVMIIGNFPYNISAPILFKVLEYKEQVQKVVGMFQKEVAERITASHGNKKYGILSVLMQTYYNTELLFTLGPEKFYPPPKVNSAVIKLEKKQREKTEFSNNLFIKVVKTAFNQRRKMLKNSMKSFFQKGIPEHHFMTLRPEQLSPQQFEELTIITMRQMQ